jgi:hypothetical protein
LHIERPSTFQLLWALPHAAAPPSFSPFQQYHFYRSCVKRKREPSNTGSYTKDNLLFLLILVGYKAVAAATLLSTSSLLWCVSSCHYICPMAPFCQDILDNDHFVRLFFRTRAYSSQISPSFTSESSARTPWLSSGLSQSMRVNTFSASRRRPKRHMQRP